MNKLTCTSCGAALDANTIDRSLGLISCTHCRSVYPIKDLVGAEQPFAGSSITGVAEEPMRPEVPLPEKFVVDRRTAGLKVSWRWFSPTFVFLAFFCVFWDGFLVVWYAATLSTALSGQMGPEVLLPLLFPLIHVAVGVGLTYYTLAGFLNRTTLTVARAGRLEIRHSPLPWRLQPTIEARQLQQLYVKKTVTRNKNGTTTSYGLHAVDKNNKDMVLLQGLEADSQALWLEREIEDLLGIVDRPVAGDYTG